MNGLRRGLTSGPGQFFAFMGVTSLGNDLRARQ